GKWIAFQSGNRLKKVPIEGGAGLAVADVNPLNGMDWAPGDVIVLGAMGSTHGLSRISAAGASAPVAFTQRDTSKKEVDHIWPLVAPDGKTVVFAIWYGTLKTSTLAVTSLDDGKVTTLDVQGIAPLGVFGKQLVYVRADGVVMAVPFDGSARRVSGPP